MSKFLLITKINLLNIFNVSKLISFRSKTDKKKKVFKSLIITGIFIYVAVGIYILIHELMPAFISINKPLYALGMLFSVCSLYIFFANIIKIKSVLFDFKDYDLLNSLPISRNMILASKIVSLYIVNLLYTIVIMIPGYIAYINFVDLPHDWLFFILLPTIPVIPILVSSIIGIILSWITSLFSNKNIGSYVSNILLITVAFLLYFSIYNVDNAQIVNNGVNLVNSLSHYYPLTTIFVNLLGKLDFVNLLIYFISPVILTSIFIIFINHGYIRLRTRLLKQNVKNDYKISEYNVRSPIVSLYRKEIRKYFSSSLYVINSAFGCILLFIFIIAILIFKDNAINYLNKITGMSDALKTNIFLILSLICTMSSTTNSSISLEGKNFWILKMLPVSVDKIFLGKILVNLSILVPTIIVGGTFFGIYLHLSLVEFIFIYLTPLAYAIFTSCLGLLLNVMFPVFDYENEVKVIKQSLAVFLSVIIGMTITIIPFVITKIDIDLIILITSIMFLLDILIVIILHFYGERKLKRL